MAEYIVPKNSEKTFGIVGYSKAVFESIAALSLDEVKDARAASDTAFSKSITCKVVKQNIVITMNVLVNSGANVNEISNAIQEKASSAIAQMTSFKNLIINVNIVGFYFN